MFEEVSALKLSSAPRRFARPCLIAQVERASNARPSAEMTALASAYPDASIEVVQEEPFWKEIDRFYDVASNLNAATLDWLSLERSEAPAQ